MIKFASGRIGEEWSSPSLVRNIRSMVNTSAVLLYQKYNLDLILTCIFRTFDEDAELYHSLTHEPGVHCYWRAADASVRNLNDAQIQDVVSHVNGLWQYDPERPEMMCAIYEGPGTPDSSAPHLHYQTHSRTIPITASEDTEETAVGGPVL